MLLKSELLAAVRDRLADPSHWTQGWAATTATGSPTLENDPRAVAWCLSGATNRELPAWDFEANHLRRKLFRDLLVEFHAQFPNLFHGTCCAIQTYNDAPSMTHADILRVLEKTYATLVERGE